MSDQDRSAWVTLEQYNLEVQENERLREQLEKANRSLALQVSRRSKECALLKGIIDTNKEFRACLPDDWEGDPLQDAIDVAAKHLTDEHGQPAARQEAPRAYYVEHPKFGVELSLDAPSEHAIERGWVGTPLFAKTS